MAGDRPEWADDIRFATNPARVQNREILVPLLADMIKLKTKDQWISLLEAAGVPCGPINNLDEVFQHPQIIARNMCITLPHPSAGEVRLVANPIKMSATPIQYETPPPLLGQHTEAILRHVLHYSSDEIAQLKALGVTDSL
jgi:formyl-CoA transferase